jgi:hypothetical protein
VKDVSASHDTGGVGDAERHYISSNCDVKVLLVLCRGIFVQIPIYMSNSNHFSNPN